MESRQDIHSQTKKIIFSVYNYLKELATDNNYPEFAIFFRKTLEVTAEACGVSVASVKRICSEGKKLAEDDGPSASFKSPIKTYIQLKYATDLDDFDNEVLRRTIHSF